MNSLYFSPMLLGINVLIASTIACIALWWFSRPYRGPGVWTCGVSTLMFDLLLFIGYMTTKNPLLNIIRSVLQLAGETLLILGVFCFLERPAPWWMVPVSVATISPVMVLALLGYADQLRISRHLLSHKP